MKSIVVALLVVNAIAAVSNVRIDFVSESL